MIPVQYWCNSCGVRGATVIVRERFMTENVVEWLEGAVTPAISIDHRHKSPLCDAEKMTQVKIPLAGDGSRVGDPVKH